MEKEDTLSKSKVFHILEKEPERVRLEPKILYEGGSLDPMKNRIFIEVAGKYVQTSFHLCESCPKTSMARLIKVKNAVRHSLVSHSKVHEKSKISKNPITKHFSSKIQIPTERLTIPLIIRHHHFFKGADLKFYFLILHFKQRLWFFLAPREYSNLIGQFIYYFWISNSFLERNLHSFV